jgi:hypothetical protein
MTFVRALSEALACYQTAVNSKGDDERAAAAERAQNFAVVAGLSAILAVLALIAWLIVARCVGECIGAGLATAVPDLSGWVTSEYVSTALSSAGYGASWALAAVSLGIAERRVCGTMMAGLGMGSKG